MFKKLQKYDDFIKESKTVGPVTFDGYDDVVDYMLQWHEGQWRKFQKTPYAYHPARVAKIIEKFTNDSRLVIAAFLHDVLEDTKENWKNMATKFGEGVAKLVQELTSHIPSHRKDNKVSFLIKKMIKISDDALTIKLADRLDNVSDIIDNNVPEKVKTKLWSETTSLLLNLERFRELKTIHNTLISKIRIYLNAYKGIKNESDIVLFNTLDELNESNL